MSIEEIEAKLEEIKANSGDAEVAHISEDELREEFIKYVASLTELPSLSAKAEKILSSNEIEFPRWCA